MCSLPENIFSLSYSSAEVAGLYTHSVGVCMSEYLSKSQRMAVNMMDVPCWAVGLSIWQEQCHICLPGSKLCAMVSSG